MDVYIKDLHVGIKNVNITCIVLDISPRITLKENREVRSLKVADSTACVNLSLWDEPGALLHTGDIVRLTKCYAQIWRNCLTLYNSKSGYIEKIGEFCMVFNESLDMSVPLPNPPMNPGPPANGNPNPGNLNNGGPNKGNNMRQNPIDRDAVNRYSNNPDSSNKNNPRNTRVRS
uniref:SOSS complex subunit B homolog n=1 Tax=Cacopsylla melanoneura TaxID=428564 RepID=A0A8D8LL69_9HEMI